MTKYNFTLSVWSKRYINIFIQTSLPIIYFQIKNIFKKKELGTFFIYSDSIGIKSIAGSDIYCKLKKVINVNLVDFKENMKIKEYDDKFQVSTSCFLQTYNYLRRHRNTNYIFSLTPESILSNNFFINALNFLKKNDLLLVTGLRVNDSKLFKKYKNKIYLNQFNYFNVKNLITDYYNNKNHLSMRHNFFEKEYGFNSFPSQFHFKINKNINLIKAFHLHPAAFKINKKINYMCFDTIDGDFINSNFDLKTIKSSVMTDNSFILELTPENNTEIIIKTSFISSLKQLLFFYDYAVGKTQYNLFKNNILINNFVNDLNLNYKHYFLFYLLNLFNFFFFYFSFIFKPFILYRQIYIKKKTIL